MDTPLITIAHTASWHHVHPEGRHLTFSDCPLAFRLHVEPLADGHLGLSLTSLKPTSTELAVQGGISTRGESLKAALTTLLEVLPDTQLPRPHRMGYILHRCLGSSLLNRNVGCPSQKEPLACGLPPHPS